MPASIKNYKPKLKLEVIAIGVSIIASASLIFIVKQKMRIILSAVSGITGPLIRRYIDMPYNSSFVFRTTLIAFLLFIQQNYIIVFTIKEER